MSYNLDKIIENEIIELAKKYNIEKVILFGSRARGDNREDSDIDLALCGGNYMYFDFDFNDEVKTNLKFDITYLDHEIDNNLRNSINRDGILLYEKKIDEQQRYEYFSKAFNNLEESLKINPPYDAFIRDYIMQLFNLCFEHSWKLIKSRLESQGKFFDEIVAPSVIIKIAYKYRIIPDEQHWLDIVKTYNDSDVSLQLENIEKIKNQQYLETFYELKKFDKTDSINQ